MKMRAPQKREKRESGKSWRDYATDEDFDEDGNLLPPVESVEGEAEGEGAVPGEGESDEEGGVREWEGDEGEAGEEGGDIIEDAEEDDADMDDDDEDDDEGGR
jgi:hypothetical protein